MTQTQHGETVPGRLTRETVYAVPLACGHAPQPTFYSAGSVIGVGDDAFTMTGDEVMFPGWATMPDGRRICPDCADTEQRGELRTASRFTGYLTVPRQYGSIPKLTTWTGGLLAYVVKMSRNERQTFVTAIDVHGIRWTGIGPSESGTYVSMRRLKGEPVTGIHASCKACELDIEWGEDIQTATRGRVSEWRDRGGNAACEQGRRTLSGDELSAYLSGHMTFEDAQETAHGVTVKSPAPFHLPYLSPYLSRTY
jgi:hypothetical protein